MNHVTIALEPGQVDVASQKRTYTVLEIQDILSISRPTAYALIRRITSAASGWEAKFGFPKELR